MPLRLEVKDLTWWIDHLEANGADASQLREILEESQSPHDPHQEDVEDYIARKLRESTVENGVDLVCPICTNEYPQLVAGVCYNCFRGWSLAARRR